MENTNETRGGYYAVIPAHICGDNKLNADCKMLYAEISRLANAQGYCYAGNAHFARSANCSEPTIKRRLKALADAGYIVIERERARGGEYTGRRIYLSEAYKNRAQTAENDHSSKMSCGENPEKTPENDHGSYMSCGENTAHDHSSKMSYGPQLKNEPQNNINIQGVIDVKDSPNIQTTVVGVNPCARAEEAREQMSQAQFDERYGFIPRGKAGAKGYREVRRVLLELAARGAIDLSNLTSGDVFSFVGSLYKDKFLRQRRHISDLNAYLLQCVKNTKRTVIEGVIEQPEPTQQHISASSLSGDIAIVVTGEIDSAELTDKRGAEVALEALLLTLEPDINSLAYDVWIKPLKAIGYAGTTLVLQAPTWQFRDEVMSRYMYKILNSLRGVKCA